MGQELEESLTKYQRSYRKHAEERRAKRRAPYSRRRPQKESLLTSCPRPTGRGSYTACTRSPWATASASLKVQVSPGSQATVSG